MLKDVAGHGSGFALVAYRSYDTGWQLMAIQSQPAAQPPTTAAAPAPPRAVDNIPPGTEDARFIAFAKENIGLLAGVASVPLLSSAAGALKPPMQMDQLTVLSSLLCVIVFAACFTLRGPLGAAPRSRHIVVKALPGIASLVIVGLAIYLIASYSTLQKQYEIAQRQQEAAAATQKAPMAPSPQPTEAAPSTAKSAVAATEAPGATTKSEKDSPTRPRSDSPTVPAPENLRTQIILFVAIYPILILALGLILVTNFTQQTAHDIQTLVEQKLPDQAKALFNHLQLIARFYDLGRVPGQEKFLKIGEALIEDRNGILQKLSVGIIELGGLEAIRMQQVLVQTFNDSFDAVSCCDLDFWVNIGTDEMSRDYFRLNLEALKRSNKVTRLLIFDDAEVERTRDITAAIGYHQQYGIAWAAVPYMDLDPSTREEDEDVAIDFGLYDDSKVAIYFRDYQSGTRKLRAVFPGPGRKEFVLRQRRRYADLVAQCWLVSSEFLNRLEKLPPEELTAIKQAAVRNSLVTAHELGLAEQAQQFQRLGASLDPATLSLKDCFLFPNCEGDIQGSVERMYQLRRRCPDLTVRDRRAVATISTAAVSST